jgi:hypothetical protein
MYASNTALQHIGHTDRPAVPTPDGTSAQSPDCMVCRVGLGRLFSGLNRRSNGQSSAASLRSGSRCPDRGRQSLNLVFTSIKGTPLEPCNVERAFDALIKRAEMSRIRITT